MTATLENGVDGLQPSTYHVEVQYERILRLRDDIFANKHPTLKLLKQVPPNSQPSAPGLSLPVPVANGVSKSTVHASPSLQNGASRTYSSQSAPSGPKHSPAWPLPSAAPGSSGIDPIFLKKSDVLVRAEGQQKRQRIERALEEQSTKKPTHSQQSVLEEHALPNFSVVEVLKKAQEIVKPVKVMARNATDRKASSSDSFDESTFYSSQMDSMSNSSDVNATKATEAEEQEANGPQPMEMDSDTAADEPAASGAQGQANNPPIATGAAPEPVLSSQQQIARLEAELRRLRGDDKRPEIRKTPPPTREQEVIDEPPYSPPDVRASPSAQPAPNHVSTSNADQHPPQPIPRRSSKALEPQSREFLRSKEIEPSLVSNDMRIVRSHITSPLAPQPARVSPLAVAKEPPVPQVNGNRQPNGDAAVRGDVPGPRKSPKQPAQPINPKKRRRRNNSGETARNVAPRREAPSPERIIKAEPVSPPQQLAAVGAWRPPRREEVHRPIVDENASPRPVPVDRVVQAPRPERQGPVYAVDQGRPFTPNGYGGRLVEMRDEPDLRRIVSAKQVRAPMSPFEQYSSGQPYPTRAASQVYIPQSIQDGRHYVTGQQVHMASGNQEPMGHYRASMQPPPISMHGANRSPSPAPRQIHRSPPRQGSVFMAPPPRRIVVDQYGNRFVEAPASSIPERQMSTVPASRSNEYEPRFEQPMGASSVRQPSMDVSRGEPRYIQRPPSPTSPRYISYPSQAPPARSSSIVYLDQERHPETQAAYKPNPSMVHYIDYPAHARPEEVSRPREPARVASVRPRGSHYESQQAQMSRAPSARPELGRVVSLDGRREEYPPLTRQISVRPEEMYVRRPVPVPEERPRYQYVQENPEPRYAVQSSYDDGPVFDANRSAGRRVVQ